MPPKKKSDSSTESKAAQSRTTRAKKVERRKPGKRSEDFTRSLELQAFRMSARGLGCRDIAKRLGITQETASKYIRAEAARVREALQRDRDAQAVEALAFYDEVAELGLELARKADKPFMQPLVKGLDAAVKARERKDKILGIDAPTKVDIGLQKLFAAFDEE